MISLNIEKNTCLWIVDQAHVFFLLMIIVVDTIKISMPKRSKIGK